MHSNPISQLADVIFSLLCLLEEIIVNSIGRANAVVVASTALLWHQLVALSTYVYRDIYCCGFSYQLLTLFRGCLLLRNRIKGGLEYC